MVDQVSFFKGGHPVPEHSFSCFVFSFVEYFEEGIDLILKIELLFDYNFIHPRLLFDKLLVPKVFSHLVMELFLHPLHGSAVLVMINRVIVSFFLFNATVGISFRVFVGQFRRSPLACLDVFNLLPFDGSWGIMQFDDTNIVH